MRTIAPLLCAIALSCRGPEAAPEPASGPPRTVLVELYSSQGCDSCPAADALVQRLPQLGFPEDQVIPLTFHVTYWDDLGWSDPFASPLHDQRQIGYAHALPMARAADETTIRGPYTPQMVVDGRVHFSGALEKVATAEITRARARPAAIELSARAVLVEGAVVVDIRSSAAPGAALDTDRAKVGLFAVLVQPYADTEVPRGENAGKRLSERNVVRGIAGPKLFRSGRAVNDTHLELALPPGLTDPIVVVFAQDLATLEIHAARALAMEPARPPLIVGAAHPASPR